MVNEYPTMHYFGNRGHTQAMIAYMILLSFSGNSSENCIVGMLLTCPIIAACFIKILSKVFFCTLVSDTER